MKRRLRHLLIILTILATQAHATPPIPSPGCSGIKIWGWEFIEAQGFLGLATPKADAWEPIRAFRQAMSQPDSPVLRYCELAKAYYKQLYGWNLTEMTLVCRSDSFPDQGTEMDRREGPARIEGECFLSLERPLSGHKPSFYELKKYAIVYGFAGEDLPKSKNRHDMLKDRANRRRLYAKALVVGVTDELDRESRGLSINLRPEFERYRATPEFSAMSSCVQDAPGVLNEQAGALATLRVPPGEHPVGVAL